MTVTIRMMRGMMMMMMVTILLLPDLSLAVSVVQKFVREPPDQTAAEGEHVTLPCRVDNKVTHGGDVEMGRRIITSSCFRSGRSSGPGTTSDSALTET